MSFGYFDKTIRMYFIAECTNEKMVDSYTYSQNKLNIRTKFKSPHITMMHIHINALNSDHKLLVEHNKVNSMFKKIIELKYIDLSKNMKLESSGYDMMGEFFAKTYRSSSNSNSNITDFRMVLYLYLQIFLGKSIRIKKTINDRTFYVYSYKNRELIAVPEYYHGKNIWSPHVSITKLDIIKTYNPNLYKLLDRAYKYDSIKGVTRVLSSQIKNADRALDRIHMAKDFAKISISTINI